jgi:hypothetical protein
MKNLANPAWIKFKGLLFLLLGLLSATLLFCDKPTIKVRCCWWSGCGAFAASTTSRALRPEPPEEMVQFPGAQGAVVGCHDSADGRRGRTLALRVYPASAFLGDRAVRSHVPGTVAGIRFVVHR